MRSLLLIKIGKLAGVGKLDVGQFSLNWLGTSQRRWQVLLAIVLEKSVIGCSFRSSDNHSLLHRVCLLDRPCSFLFVVH